MVWACKKDDSARLPVNGRQQKRWMDNIKEDLADEVDCLKPKTDYMTQVVVIHSAASLEAFWLKMEGKN